MPRFISIDDATPILSGASRVSVVGISGAGKSTFSQELARQLDLKYVSLDRDMLWLPGWTMRDRAEQRALHDAFVAENRWVIDGTTIGLMRTRLPRSDLLIWLRVPRHRALWGVARRVAKGYGRVRPDMADGCPEQIPDFEFLRWIWTFERKQSPRLLAAIEQYCNDLPVLVLRSHREIEALLGKLRERGTYPAQKRKGAE
ncbi:AAA family ATPase [Alphaproteobacteria bacterium GH1-50]|uniref:AAA family ATPase n=1 Tax=Kangsaoukella pontilimi TaxID=2691042 RepID=A0A7C9IQC8_9RHOB|nr:AAA family ATPase [Kangsaoukella pontilimi]MXQ06226.1 AAA family ATPase [Kangsaoukella pontilimi]